MRRDCAGPVMFLFSISVVTALPIQRITLLFVHVKVDRRAPCFSAPAHETDRPLRAHVCGGTLMPVIHWRATRGQYSVLLEERVSERGCLNLSLRAPSEACPSVWFLDGFLH